MNVRLLVANHNKTVFLHQLGIIMKRDMELIRKMLLALEKDQNPHELEGYTKEQLGYHAYLIVDGGLAKGVDSTSRREAQTQIQTALLTVLSWPGAEFLDCARDESIWAQATSKAKSVGGVSLPVLKALLIEYLKTKLGLNS